jgi:hypothetical protein
MIVTAVAGILLALTALATVFISSAAAVERVGPRDPAHGYPVWYEDSNGLKLDLCIAGPPRCLEGLPNPRQPALVSKRPALSNFPEEAFWWAGEAQVERPNGGRVLLVLAREAAFGGSDEAVRRGDQVSFSRVRIRVDQLVPGANYTVTHPYGINTFVAEDGGKRGGVINFTEDIGCALSPNPAVARCNFRDALFGQVDPFLIWDPKAGGRAPVGYVGNPAANHRVIGSPNDTNFFRIEGPDAGGRGTGIDRVQTSLFSIQGKIVGAAPSFVSLGAKPAKARPGGAVTLSGRLRTVGGPQDLAGRTIELFRRPKGATSFTPAGKVRTNATGFFSRGGVRVGKNTVFRARFAGEPGVLKASGSPPKVVRVIR